MSSFETLEETRWLDQRACLIFQSQPVAYSRYIKTIKPHQLGLSSSELDFFQQLAIIADELLFELDHIEYPLILEVITIKQRMIERGIKCSSGLLSKRMSALSNGPVCTLICGNVKNTNKKKNLYLVNELGVIRSNEIISEDTEDHFFEGRTTNISTLPQTERTDLVLLEPKQVDTYDLSKTINAIQGPSALKKITSAFISRKWAHLGALFRLLGSSENKKRITSYIASGNSRFPVQIDSITEVPSLHDNRTISIIITLCWLAMRQSKMAGVEPQNDFLIDLNDCCTLASINTGVTNRQTFWKSLTRLNNSIVRILLDDSQASNQIRAFLSLRGDANHISFVANLSGVKSVNDTVSSFRWVTFTIDPSTFSSMADGMDSELSEIMLAHPELLTFRHGLTYLFYQWLNKRIGRRGNIEISTSIDQLHEDFAPTYNTQAFRADMTKIVEQLGGKNTLTKSIRSSNGAQIALHFTALGYKMFWTLDNESLVDSLRVSRNLSDSISGENSLHANYRRLDKLPT